MRDNIVQAENGKILRIDLEKTYNLKEVSAILNRSILTVRQYIKMEQVKSNKICGSYFVTESALKSFDKFNEIMV